MVFTAYRGESHITLLIIGSPETLRWIPSHGRYILPLKLLWPKYLGERLKRRKQLLLLPPPPLPLLLLLLSSFFWGPIYDNRGGRTEWLSPWQWEHEAVVYMVVTRKNARPEPEILITFKGLTPITYLCQSCLTSKASTTFKIVP